MPPNAHSRSGFPTSVKISSMEPSQPGQYFLATGSGNQPGVMFRQDSSFNAQLSHNTSSQNSREHGYDKPIGFPVPTCCPRSHGDGVVTGRPGQYFYANNRLDLDTSASGSSGNNGASELAKLLRTPVASKVGHGSLGMVL
ncbi:hypothetical protein CEK25_011308 [Fusarium fujikuroi]|nr:hypothetical protein CEK25_011308 [Fusarium fujikuroi]